MAKSDTQSTVTATKRPRKPRTVWPIRLQVQDNGDETTFHDIVDADYESESDAFGSVTTPGTYRVIRVGPEKVFEEVKKIVAKE